MGRSRDGLDVQVREAVLAELRQALSLLRSTEVKLEAVVQGLIAGLPAESE